ncbi:MAG: aminoacyl-tRNA hydrolase [Deltaproteobacteria bacterium]|nr:aminoacyl-tRNA hydrolase [Deltaproteobacteria bacterium]|tara:strand:+ start:8411 stop:9043 length:633 start_codon:yes stop_codon:yes gene_type:complete
MWLLVGLGNPGSRYARDRHNIGFRIIEHLSHTYDIPLSEKKYKSFFGRGSIHHTPVVLVQPQTYMNLSGEAVAPLQKKFDIPLDQILIIHDELNLDFGRLRLKQGGGAGGHNGLRSLHASLGSPDYPRLRVGIGRPAKGADIAEYVLAPFTDEETQALPSIIQDASDMLACCCRDGLTQAMNRWNRRKPGLPSDSTQPEAVVAPLADKES